MLACTIINLIIWNKVLLLLSKTPFCCGMSRIIKGTIIDFPSHNCLNWSDRYCIYWKLTAWLGQVRFWHVKIVAAPKFSVISLSKFLSRYYQICTNGLFNDPSPPLLVETLLPVFDPFWPSYHIFWIIYISEPICPYFFSTFLAWPAST